MMTPKQKYLQCSYSIVSLSVARLRNYCHAKKNLRLWYTVVIAVVHLPKGIIWSWSYESFCLQCLSAGLDCH